MISRSPNSTADKRRGVTLTEVLMAMLIMSIGVSFVAAVFPLSVLRSIQASQLTSATILRFQAEAIIDMFPEMIHNPDGLPNRPGPDGTLGTGDDIDTFREHFGRNYLIDPWGYHVHLQDGTVFDRFDPQSGNTINGAAVSDWFGVDGSNIGWVQRFDGGVIAGNPNPGVAADVWAAHLEQMAALLASSTDRWTEDVNSEDITPITSASGAVIGLSFADEDLSMLSAPVAIASVPDRELARITIFDDRGRESQSYPITHVDGQNVFWSEDWNGDDTFTAASEDLNANGSFDARQLPVRIAGRIGHATIESSQLRYYTWLMSVRKFPDGNASVDVAVMFNRGVDATREYAYQATFVPGGDLVGINYDASTEPEPFLKKGGYVFDAARCRWYRIQQIQTAPPEYPGYEFVLTVDTTLTNPTGEDQNLNLTLEAAEDVDGDGAIDFGRAVLLPGVIEVYPLGTYNIPEEL